MKVNKIIISLIIALSTVALCYQGTGYTAKVQRAIDGDTIELENGEEARESNTGLWYKAPEEKFAPAPDKKQEEDIIVYITKTGKKYHRDGCSYLKKSKIAITLKEAINRGYTPCSKCKPPNLKNN